MAIDGPTSGMAASWDDIEIALNNRTLEQKDRATLEAFSRVEPPPSTNPSFRARFDHAMERIRRRLDKLEAEDKARETAKAPNWARISVWIGLGSFILGYILAYLTLR